MKKYIFFIGLVLALLTVVSCDRRGRETPLMYVYINAETLYLNTPLEAIDVTVLLVGETRSSFANRTIDLTYNTDVASINSVAGDERIMITDDLGRAEGLIYARRQGALNIDFHVRGQREVRHTRRMQVLNPTIHSITATPNEIPADNDTPARIDVVVRPAIAGQRVLFSTSRGNLEYTERETVEGGVAWTFLRGDGGFAYVTARLYHNQSQYQEVMVIFTH